jgi:hypothetical protein
MTVPAIGATKADGYEGDGYVVIRHESTEMVQRALELVIETVKVHYA